MTESVAVRTGATVIWHADHRSGICDKCDLQMEWYDHELPDGRVVKRVKCPKCGGTEGKLISRGLSIQPPKPPACIRPRCIWKFIKDSLFVLFLSSYHSRRVAYAEANRHKKILERYRTGEPSPQTLWQAIHANLKLTCPVCRKYNVDPLLFRR